MKLYLLSDNVDTLTGMRLAGVDGIVAHTADEVLSAMKQVLEDSSIGILLVTKNCIWNSAKNYWKYWRSTPLRSLCKSRTVTGPRAAGTQSPPT